MLPRQPAGVGESTLLRCSSTPPGAEIELDGRFIGQTPSTVPVAAGEHFIRISKPKYKQWERKIKTAGGEVTIDADLEPED